MPTERKKLLLRLDPAVHDALARWSADELRSTNAQIEFLLRRALGEAGRLPGNVGRIRRPGRPPAEPVDRPPAELPRRPPAEPATGSDETATDPSDHTGP